MSGKFFRKSVIAVKVEGTAGTSSAPTAGADAMLVSNVTFEPMVGTMIDRKNLVPYQGSQGRFFAGLHGKLNFDVEIAGSGAAGTAPAYAALLRAASMAEALTASTKADYELVSDAQETVTILANLDGDQHLLTYGRANMKMAFTAQQVPKFTFEGMGIFADPTAVNFPTPDYDDFVKPVIVNKANTTVSLFGAARVVESLSLDLGLLLRPHLLVGEESIQIEDRKVVGEIVLDAAALSAGNWYSICKGRTRGALAVVHGTTAGNIVEVSGPTVELGEPKPRQMNGVKQVSIPIEFCADAGDDELIITVK